MAEWLIEADEDRPQLVTCYVEWNLPSEHDVVALNADHPEDGLQVGDVGAVVQPDVDLGHPPGLAIIWGGMGKRSRRWRRSLPVGLTCRLPHV